MKKGFYLVELMVVVGILSIIMLTISQPVASIIKYQRESQIADNMRDNLQFVINKMEKELKTSSNVYVNEDGALKFKDQEGGFVTYSFDGVNKVMKRNNISFTDNTVFKVEGLNFIVTDKPNLSKLVTVSIDAKSLDNKDSVTMQTSVAPVNDKPVITNGLTVHLDAGNKNSYPEIGNTWFDLSGNNNGNLRPDSGGPTHNSVNGGSFVFDGLNNYVSLSQDITLDFNKTFFFYISALPSTGIYHLLNSNSIGGYNNRIGISRSALSFYIGNKGNKDLIIRHFTGGPQENRFFAILTDNTNLYTIEPGMTSLPLGTSLNSLPDGARKFDSIGLKSTSSVWQYFNGRVHYFAYYNRALNLQEIQYNFNVLKGRFGIN